MSIEPLFIPGRLGGLDLPNRLVHSATYEGLATESGRVTDALVRRYRRLAAGQVGLIIPGFMFVHPDGRADRFQTGIHDDGTIPGLARLTEAVHDRGGRIVFQLAHGGRQTHRGLIGRTPLGPSRGARDPIYFFRPRAMTEAQIHETIADFVAAAGRALAAGADGVQLHAAHGYLINQFLSPFFNRRRDAWGGSDENRFRFLREIVVQTRQIVPKDLALLVKLNTADFTPRPGITPDLAARYAGWLAGLGIDGLEVSGGTAVFSFMNVCRGRVPVRELTQWLPWWKKPIGRMMMSRLQGGFDLEEGYNLEAADTVRAALGATPLIVVGGMRRAESMARVLADGRADFISLSRPFIREPWLVKRIREGKTDRAACISCNRCLAALPNDLPVRCYVNGFPSHGQ